MHELVRDKLFRRLVSPLVFDTLTIWTWQLQPYIRFLAGSMFMKLISITATGILLPVLIGFTVNRLAENPGLPKQDIIMFLSWAVILLFIGVVAEYSWNRLCAYYLARARRDLELYTFKKLLQKSYRFHAEQSGPAVADKTNRFTISFQYFHDVVLRDLLTILLTFSMSLVVTFAFSWRVGLFILVWVFAYGFIIATVSRKRFEQKRASAAAVTKMISSFTDIMSNMITVKTFVREPDELRRFEAASTSKMQAGEQAWVWSAGVTALIGSMMAILNVSVLAISVYRIQIGAMDIGILVLIQVFVIRLTVQLWQLGNIIRDLDRSFTESAEMTEILTKEPDFIDPPHTKHRAITKGSIGFERVYFRYPDAHDHDVIFKDLSLSIKPGEKVGIVGPSGSGKTTLVRTLLRLATITRGRITIDGFDIRTITRKDLRDAIAYVPQDPALFNRTLLENIRYGRPSASFEEVLEAVKKARADRFIELLPNGYKTMMGERGYKLSHGQRQRIAIARAMLKPSPILILDEATSALDLTSERMIQNALDELMNNRTTIVIAHRIETVKKMDRIIVLKYGEIIEEGTHAELSNRRGAYAALWSQQND